jgi:hypothetical protein
MNRRPSVPPIACLNSNTSRPRAVVADAITAYFLSLDFVSPVGDWPSVECGFDLFDPARKRNDQPNQPPGYFSFCSIWATRQLLRFFFSVTGFCMKSGGAGNTGGWLLYSVALLMTGVLASR